MEQYGVTVARGRKGEVQESSPATAPVERTKKCGWALRDFYEAFVR